MKSTKTFKVVKAVKKSKRTKKAKEFKAAKRFKGFKKTKTAKSTKPAGQGEVDIRLKTSQVADALKISTSTVKRWVDHGDLPAGRTVGKHRLIQAEEAICFARKNGLPTDGLERLVAEASRNGHAHENSNGHAAIAVAKNISHAPSEANGAESRPLTEISQIFQPLISALTTGHAVDARRLVSSVRSQSVSAEFLAETLICPVLREIHNQWSVRTIGIDQSHGADQIIGSILNEWILQAQDRQEEIPNRPKALGATPQGDFHSVSCLLGECVLVEQGWNVINYGSNLPLAVLSDAVRRERPQLVWLCVNHLDDSARFLQEYEMLANAINAEKSTLIVGGQAITTALRPQLASANFGESVADLAALARKLLDSQTV